MTELPKGRKAYPHAEDQEPDLLHERVLFDLLLSFVLRGERIVALLAQLNVHDARLDEVASHVLQLQVQVCEGTTG